MWFLSVHLFQTAFAVPLRLNLYVLYSLESHTWSTSQGTMGQCWTAYVYTFTYIKSCLNKAHMPSISIIKYIFFLSSPRCGWWYSDLMRSGCLFFFSSFPQLCCSQGRPLSPVPLHSSPGPPGAETLCLLMLDVTIWERKAGMCMTSLT